MNPTCLFRPARLLLVALLALPCLAIQAQEGTPPSKGTVRPDPDFITIDFPGGTLSKLAAKLNEAGDAKLSIVQAAGLDPVLPAFSVRAVRVPAVIAALGRLLEPQGYLLTPIDTNLAVLAKIDNAKPAGFASLQLGRKLNAPFGWTVGEITAAIKGGAEFANPEKMPSTLRLSYHPATKMLFLAGTPQEVDVAVRVFESLPDYSPKKDPAPDSEKK